MGGSRDSSHFFHRYALANNDGSIDTANDIAFSDDILFCYALSIVTTLVFALVVWRRPSYWFAAPGGLLVFAVVNVIRARPEGVIIIVPDLEPIKSMWISGIALAITAFVLFINRRRNAGPDARADGTA